MPQPNLAIVIPVYRSTRQLGKCLSALQASVYQNFNVIVVDHGETNDISRFIATDFPEAVCLRGSSTLWWSGATNLGVKYAMDNSFQLIMLLNHDCFVCSNTVGDLVNSIDVNYQTIVAPVQRNLSNGNIVVTARSCFVLGFPTIISPQWLQKRRMKFPLRETGLIIGGRGAVVSARIFEKVGLFDQDSLPHYGADHDFYLRCKKNRIRLLVNTMALVNVDDIRNSNVDIHSTVTIQSILQALKSRNSHHNVSDVRVLFNKHSATHVLAVLGSSLYLLRFLFMSILVALYQRLKRTE